MKEMAQWFLTARPDLERPEDVELITLVADAAAVPVASAVAVLAEGQRVRLSTYEILDADDGSEAVNAAADRGTDLILLAAGDRSADTCAQALIALLGRGDAPAVTPQFLDAEGRIDHYAWMRQCAAIRDLLAWARLREDPQAALLSRSEARLLAAACAAIRTTGERQTPMLLDGVVPAAAALHVLRGDPGIERYLRPGHASTHPAERTAWTQADLSPLTELNLSRTDGAGAIAGLVLLRLACDLRRAQGDS